MSISIGRQSEKDKWRKFAFIEISGVRNLDIHIQSLFTAHTAEYHKQHKFNDDVQTIFIVKSFGILLFFLSFVLFLLLSNLLLFVDSFVFITQWLLYFDIMLTVLTLSYHTIRMLYVRW